MEPINRFLNSSVDWLWTMDDHAIVWWTLILTAAGVAAGLFVLILTYYAVRDTRVQSKASARATRAQFGLLLRQAFASHNEAHLNLRPGGIWHRSSNLPAPDAVCDFSKIENYMGLLEYCDELLEEGFLDLAAFVRGYRYRVDNLLTNNWVVSKKLIGARSGWLGFINLCYRLKVPNLPSGISPLSQEECAVLYPHSAKRRHRTQ
jgi:hypothetical protein